MCRGELTIHDCLSAIGHRRCSIISSLIILLFAATGCAQQMARQPRYNALEPSQFFDDGKSARDLLPDTVARGELRTSEYFTGAELAAGAEAPTAESAQPEAAEPTAMPQATGQPTSPVPSTPGAVLTEQAASGAEAGGQATTAPTGEAATGAEGTPGAEATPQATPGAEGTPISQVTEFPFPVTMEVLQRGQERFNIFCAPCHGRTGDGNGMIVQRGYPQPPSYHTEDLRNAPPGHFVDVITNGFARMPSYADQVPVPDRWAITAYIRALQLSEDATLDDVPPDVQQELQAAEQ
jgi:mono/diheme cytochrome c family protein